MRMGRKIPGKKHRTVVYPEKQRARRLESLKNKINNPPANVDEQEIPRSLLEIMELKKEANSRSGHIVSGRVTRKRRRKGSLLSIEQFLDENEPEVTGGKPDKFIPKLVQKPQESPERFLGRVAAMTQKIIKETQFEDKYGVSIKKDMESGNVIGLEKIHKLPHGKRSTKKTLSEKRKEKKLDKKNKESGVVDFSHLKDVVEFGEVVDRPPVKLPTIKSSSPQKKNKYNNLLLGTLLESKQKNVSSMSRIEFEKKEKERKFIVDAYRERKKKQMLKHVTSDYD